MNNNNNKYRSHGIIGTIVVHVILIVALAVAVMQSTPIEEEGLLVNYGDSNDGSGSVEPEQSQPAAQTQPTPPPPIAEPTPAQPTPSEKAPQSNNEKVVDTQDFEEAAALKEAKRKQAEAKAQAEAVAKAKAKAEAEAVAKAKAEADAKAKAIAAAEAAAKAKAEQQSKQAAAAQSNIAKGFAGKGTGSNSSEGNTNGSGNQGSLTGSVNSKNRGSGSGSGNSFSLSGRTLVGSLPKPSYNVQEEGIVVVEITVDKYGKVTSANVQMNGTTIQNTNLWNVAKQAAMKARFNENASAAAIQKGTITYRFQLE